MSVYVDNYFAVYRGMRMSHMTADTLEELHAMAEKLGLRKWFQDTGTPHYDVSKSKREEAIRLGAIPEGVFEGARRRLNAKGIKA
jgi:Protein of unknown function (DUF4031)